MTDRGPRVAELIAKFYRVEVSDADGQIVAIEPNILAGRDIGPPEEAAIRMAIQQLTAFIGLTDAERRPVEQPKCDGNHGGPRCADPECWNDEGSARHRAEELFGEGFTHGPFCSSSCPCGQGNGPTALTDAERRPQEKPECQ